ncbi:DUF916 domain-containing protein [Amycolatopsis cynarae]|uniref:DUF916 domain-containing protein n=1 Tax=Amycolatopsis cynarae TaxID=2995223 RepID=A0ABY7B7P0_9PSEU|nr:DUF916 domain-containing protein [Amycolatopsis sp. HUAS 11-8]WAL68359.1 DUF916 domain-containing protein [Amycolatopsis sp. HUAS 11-8]
MTRLLRRALAAALLGVLALAFSPPALADPAPAPSPGDAPRATFGVRPATEREPDRRSAFTYSATPGARLTDYLAVSNVGEAPVTVRIYAGDAFNTPDGGFDLLASGATPVDVGAWTKPAQDTVTVAPRSVQIVPFTLTIPANATPGDHTGGIVAALTTDRTTSGGQKVALEQRVGARIYLRVTGEVHPALSIDGLTADYHGGLFSLGGDVTLSYTVHNTGNTRLAGTRQVRVTTPWGSTVDAPALPKLGELLPGASIRMSTQVGGLPAAGRLTGTVRVEPAPAPGHQDPAAAAAEASVAFAAVPWLPLAVAAVLLLTVLWLRWRRRRARAVRQAADGETRQEAEHAAAR